MLYACFLLDHLLLILWSEGRYTSGVILFLGHFLAVTIDRWFGTCLGAFTTFRFVG